MFEIFFSLFVFGTDVLYRPLFSGLHGLTI